MHLTRAQSAILGYLISINANESSGGTIKEIIAATGLGQNTVYMNLRNGVPGVLKCKYAALTGAAMYYVDPAALNETVKAINAGGGAASVVDSPMQLAIWARQEPVVKAGLEKTYLSKPASWERLGELTAGIEQIPANWPDKNRLKQLAIIGQSIALLSLDLLEKE